MEEEYIWNKKACIPLLPIVFSVITKLNSVEEQFILFKIQFILMESHVNSSTIMLSFRMVEPYNLIKILSI